MADYCTLDQVKHARGMEGFSFEDDEGTTAIAAASQLIDQKTNRQFTADTVESDRVFWPQNTGYCIIDDCWDFVSLNAQNVAWALNTDYLLEPLNAPSQGRPYTAIRTIARPFLFTKAELDPGGWTIFDGRITVTGKWGWPAVPATITQACILLASRLITRARSAPLAVVGGGVDSYATRLGGIDPDIEDLLNPYVINFVA